MNPLDQQGTVSVVCFSILAHTALKGFIILLLAAILTAFMRRTSAARRHLIWLLAFLAVGVLPLLSCVLPALNLPLLPAQPLVEASEVASTDHSDSDGARASVSESIGKLHPAVAPEPLVPAGPPVTPNAPAPLIWRQWLLAVWCVGFLLMLSPILMGLLSLTVLRFKCGSLKDASLERLTAQYGEYFKLRTSVSIVQHDGDGKRLGPMVWGAFRPVLSLPADCLTWSRQRTEIVLLHELAHVKRNDWLTQLLCTVVCAMHWFNPLAWLAVRRARLEREKACDDLVLQAGIDGPDYAQHLLSIARDLARSQPLASVALAVVRTSQIEKRVCDILDSNKGRGGITRSMRLFGLIVVALIVLPLAAMRAAAMAAVPSTPCNPVAGWVVDEEGNGMAGVTISAHLRDSRASYFVQRVQSDVQGRFEIAKVPRDQGDYESCDVSFKLEGMVPAWLENVFSLSGDQRRNQRVVMLRGHSVSGTLLNDLGRPAPGILVEVIPAWRETPAGRTRSWQYRKAAETDARGQFVIKGVNTGDYHVQAFDVPVLRKAVTETFVLADDIRDLNLQLTPMTLPAETHPIDVLGMKVANLNESIREAFGLDTPYAYGVLVLDPGKDHLRFGIGELQPGDCFSSVSGESVRSIPDFVGMLLEHIPQEYRSDSSALPFPSYYTIGVSYFFRRVSATGYRCEGMRLNKADILALQELHSQLPKTPQVDVYPNFHAEKNQAGVMLMSIKAARFAYLREHNKKPPETLDELEPYLEREQEMWHNAGDARIRREFRQYDFCQWLKDNAVLYLAEGARPAKVSGKPILGYCHTMLERYGKTCIIYDDPVLDYQIVEREGLERQLRED